MSDPEDLQSDTKSGLGDWIYQLKRIGPPATCPKVPDVMKLSLGLTKIGRGQQNDFYLDSAVLKNFISRSHVEIFGKKNENGEVEYLLTDKGLNGTFINDIRTHKTCVMEVGDKVTFGHTNGYKIQPGSYAEQPLSEFQFMFERVPRLRKVQEILSEGPIATDTPDDDSSSRVDTPDLKTESTISDRLFLSDIQSNVQQSQKSEKSATSKSRTSLKGRNRKDSSENSDMELPLPSSKNSSHSKTKSKQVTKKRNSDSSNKSLSLETSQTSSRSRASTGSARDRFSETIAAQNDDDDDDDDDDDNEDNDDEDENNDNNNEEESNNSSMSEEEEIVKPKSQVRRKRTQRKVSVQKKAPAKRKVTAPSDSDESSEEDEASKPEADQKPKAPSMKQKQLKKKKTGNDAPAIGSRKRRRKTGASGQSTSTTSAQDDLEPGVEWYEDDRCEAPDCKRPKKKRTPWVQCDDCDSWYHTVCVGANYNRLKDSDEHFNCGCE